jgi:hypothetical protein
MINTGLKYQGKIPLDCQYSLHKNEVQGGRYQWELGGYKEGMNEGECWMYFVCIYESGRMKLVEIVLRRGEGRDRESDGGSKSNQGIL